jgi:hypothetical protein
VKFAFPNSSTIRFTTDFQLLVVNVIYLLLDVLRKIVKNRFVSFRNKNRIIKNALHQVNIHSCFIKI